MGVDDYAAGTSPHTRGKQISDLKSSSFGRNIPAHAGKTGKLFEWIRCRREHPRARGENTHSVWVLRINPGTSPRTRGTLGKCLGMGCSTRNIPAHAGKTMPPGRERPFRPEHPRARGENNQSRLVWKILAGTSPRTRGKPWLAQVVAGRLRNIPAHAGKTPMMSLKTPAPVDHPRARGENGQCCVSSMTPRGTSPRTRGKPWYKHVTQFIDRNIPAHAGKTPG